MHFNALWLSTQDQKRFIALVMLKQNKTLLLASPRGFCAGVDRAIEIVEKALIKYGAPVYVRHEIVHNKFVLQQLSEKGAIFVDELDLVPNDKPVIFSAHGVPKSVPHEAQRREMLYIDATCPLVSKVHKEAERHFRHKRHLILIGHKGHPEVIGTMGQLPKNSVTLIETVADVNKLSFDCDQDLAYATQTTLSLDETQDIISALTLKFPNIVTPHKEDICYATTNRQSAIKEIAAQCDLVFVIGAANSSNSNRLVETARNYGCPKALLLPRVTEINWQIVDQAKTIGLTAGASAPDVLIQEVIEALEHRYQLETQEIILTKENIQFKLPRILITE